MLSNLLNDVITLIRGDGRSYKNIRASVQKQNVFIDDVTIPVAIGDRMVRQLPSGQEESLRVSNVNLWTGGGGIPDYYEIAYQREGTQHAQMGAVNVSVSGGTQTHINLNSTDQSVSVNNNQESDVFETIRGLLSKSVDSPSELRSLLERVNDMERGQESGNFGSAYKDFMTAAANHMTILAPVLPVLSALL